MNSNLKNPVTDELFATILKLQSMEDCYMLFEDLCTIKEIEDMASRIQAAKLLTMGMTYEQIIEQINISSATLSRVSKCVRYGKGYQKFIRKKIE